MNDIQIAMTVNGELFKYGERIRVIDKNGEEHTGTFLRCHPHSNRPDLMVIRYRRDNKEKHAVIGTDADLIERITDA